jgi:uncharacterized protein
MDFVKDLLLNYYFLACASAWLISIILKAVLHSLTSRKKFHMTDGFQNGGMPSSHTSIVAALTFAIFFRTGTNDLFFVSAIFSLLVIADAIRIRKNVGLQGEKLNELLKEFDEEPIKVVYGHSLAQVIGGAILGFLCALLFKIILF